MDGSHPTQGDRLCRAGRLTDTTVASAVGNSMFADLVSVAGHIYKHGVDGESIDTPPTISMHADEFNELIGDEFVPY